MTCPGCENLRSALEQMRAERDRERLHADIAVRERDTVEAECERYREALEVYGEHRWKCEVTRSIREGRRIDKTRGLGGCDCGWDVKRRALATHGPEGE